MELKLKTGKWWYEMILCDKNLKWIGYKSNTPCFCMKGVHTHKTDNIHTCLHIQFFTLCKLHRNLLFTMKNSYTQYCAAMYSLVILRLNNNHQKLYNQSYKAVHNKLETKTQKTKRTASAATKAAVGPLGLAQFSWLNVPFPTHFPL